LISYHLWIYACGNAVSIRFDEETTKRIAEFAIKPGYHELRFEDEIGAIEEIIDVKSSVYSYDYQGIYGKIRGPECRCITIRTQMNPEEKTNINCCSSSRKNYWHKEVAKVIEIIQKYISEEAKQTGTIDDHERTNR